MSITKRRRLDQMSSPLKSGRPMKIGILSAYDHAAHGGVKDHVVNLAVQLRRLGHEVRVIAPCSNRDGLDDPDFIPMDRPILIPTAGGGSWARVSLSVWNRRRTKAMLDAQGFDILHLHEPFAGFLTLAALSQSTAINVGTFHTYGSHRVYEMGLSWLGNRYFRMLDGRIAVSEPAREFISRPYPGDYRVIPNGVEVETFSSARAFERFEDDRTNLLWVGRLDKRKGLRYLLKAYAQLKWDWPQLRLIVVGPGNPDNESHRIMSERNLTDIEFIGPVSEHDKARYYKSAHIYCTPATGQESFGIVLLEAMAASIPIVATSIPGYASVMQHEQEGLMVPPKDEASLADAIARLLKNPELRANLGKAGRATVDAYSWETVAKRIFNYYIECAEQVHATRGVRINDDSHMATSSNPSIR